MATAEAHAPQTHGRVAETRMDENTFLMLIQLYYMGQHYCTATVTKNTHGKVHWWHHRCKSQRNNDVIRVAVNGVFSITYYISCSLLLFLYGSASMTLSVYSSLLRWITHFVFPESSSSKVENSPSMSRQTSVLKMSKSQSSECAEMSNPEVSKLKKNLSWRADEGVAAEILSRVSTYVGS